MASKLKLTRKLSVKDVLQQICEDSESGISSDDIEYSDTERDVGRRARTCAELGYHCSSVSAGQTVSDPVSMCKTNTSLPCLQGKTNHAYQLPRSFLLENMATQNTSLTVQYDTYKQLYNRTATETVNCSISS